MSRYISVEKYVDIDVDMTDFDDDDIIAEFESRGLGEVPGDIKDLLQAIFEKKRNGRDFERELDQLLYNSLGRIL